MLYITDMGSALLTTAPRDQGQEMKMSTYTDMHGEFFGRINADGNVDVLHVADGAAATRLDASVYPVGSDVSARYEHASGIVLTRADADKLGIEIE